MDRRSQAWALINFSRRKPWKKIHNLSVLMLRCCLERSRMEQNTLIISFVRADAINHVDTNWQYLSIGMESVRIVINISSLLCLRGLWPLWPAVINKPPLIYQNFKCQLQVEVKSFGTHPICLLEGESSDPAWSNARFWWPWRPWLAASGVFIRAELNSAG